MLTVYLKNHFYKNLWDLQGYNSQFVELINLGFGSNTEFQSTILYLNGLRVVHSQGSSADAYLRFFSPQNFRKTHENKRRALINPCRKEKKRVKTMDTRLHFHSSKWSNHRWAWCAHIIKENYPRKRILSIKYLWKIARPFGAHSKKMLSE